MRKMLKVSKGHTQSSLAVVGKVHPGFTDYRVVRRLETDPVTEGVMSGVDDRVILYRDGVYYISNRFAKSGLYSWRHFYC